MVTATHRFMLRRSAPAFLFCIAPALTMAAKPMPKLPSLLSILFQKLVLTLSSTTLLDLLSSIINKALS